MQIEIKGFYEKHKYTKLLNQYLENGLCEDDLIAQWPIARKKYGKDSSSLKYHICIYGEKLGPIMFFKKSQKTTMTVEKYIQKFGKEEALNLLKQRANTIETFKKRYPLNYEEKYKEYQQKRNKTYASKKGTYVKMRKTLEWHVNFYGEELGREKYHQVNNKRKYRNSKQYYIDTYGEELGIEICKENKKRTLDYFLKKYGFEEGLERYYKKRHKSIHNRLNITYSKWSIELIEEVKKQIIDLYYYGANEMIFGLSLDQMKQYHKSLFRPDLFYNGRIIEFNGDVFHANPKFFSENDFFHPFDKKKTAKEQWIEDQKRIEYFLSRNYQILIIWEEEYKLNKKDVIEKCLNFLKQ